MTNTEKLVIIRSDGGMCIDLVLSVANYDKTFDSVVRSIIRDWEFTEKEFSSYVVVRLKAAGYNATAANYEVITED